MDRALVQPIDSYLLIILHVIVFLGILVTQQEFVLLVIQHAYPAMILHLLVVLHVIMKCSDSSIVVNVHAIHHLFLFALRPQLLAMLQSVILIRVSSLK